MKYEIINPSDKCYITAEDDKTAAVAVYLLGNSWYGAKNAETGESVLGVFQEPFGTEAALELFLKEHIEDLTKAFESFEYDGEPTSLNAIGERAASMGKALRKMLNDPR